MADRYEELRVFVAAVDAGGVNAASDALGLAKSAVSRRISELEARLGAKLVDRGERRMRPTAAGMELHRLGKELLERWDAMEVGASDEPGLRTLRIAAPPLLAATVVAPAIAAALAVDPSRSFEIVGEDAPAEVTLTLSDGRVPARAGAIGRVSTIHVASPEAVGRRRIVVGNGERQSGSALLEELRVSSVDAAIAAAVAGAGVAAVPDVSARAALSAGILVEVGDVGGARMRAVRTVVATIAPGVAAEADALLAALKRLLTTGPSRR